MRGSDALTHKETFITPFKRGLCSPHHARPVFGDRLAAFSRVRSAEVGVHFYGRPVGQDAHRLNRPSFSCPLVEFGVPAFFARVQSGVAGYHVMTEIRRAATEF